MDYLSLDLESYYSPATGYTLSKMTTEEYVRDPRAEMLCLGVSPRKGNSYCVPQSDLKYWFRERDWSRTAVLCQHYQFDGLFFYHHYRDSFNQPISPALAMDTLSMARMVLPRTQSLALSALCKLFNLSEKTVPYNLFVEKRWADMSDMLRGQLMAGAQHDADLNWQVFDRLRPYVPKDAMRKVDWVVRCFTEPKLIGDAAAFHAAAQAEAARKQAMLDALGVSKADLTSNEKFADLLDALGVEIEYKTNSKGDKLIPAVAAKDPFMKRLMEDEDASEVVKAACEARVAVKSAIRETRAGRLASMAERGPLTLYYYVSGAHTHRLSGGDKVNAQNLERKGPLRKAISAPSGQQQIIIDMSQIEARLLNTLAGQTDVVKMFRDGEDIYSHNAELLYGHPVNKTDHPEKRGTGKQIELSCGYGCGAPKFKATAALGIYGPSVQLSLEDAAQAVSLYRETHPMVVETWDAAKWWLRGVVEHGDAMQGQLLGCAYDGGKITLPSGLVMDYSTLQYDDVLRQYFVQHKRPHKRVNWEQPIPDAEGDRWVWWLARGYVKTYGSKVIENLIQAIATCAYDDAVLRVITHLKLKPVLSSHDEAVFLAPASEAGAIAKEVHRLFTLPILWLPECPVAAEYIVSDRYEK